MKQTRKERRPDLKLKIEDVIFLHPCRSGNYKTWKSPERQGKVKRSGCVVPYSR